MANLHKTEGRAGWFLLTTLAAFSEAIDRVLSILPVLETWLGG